MNLFQIFVKNIINTILYFVPIIAIIIFWVLNKTDNVALILIYIAGCILFFLLSCPYIILNIKIIIDGVKKETKSLVCEVEGILSAWEWVAPFVKRKYIADLFATNYTCVYNILLAENEKYIKTSLFIPRKALEKTNFFNLYQLNYQAAKKELIIQKNVNTTIFIECTFYKYSRIIKDFKLFVKPKK